MTDPKSTVDNKNTVAKKKTAKTSKKTVAKPAAKAAVTTATTKTGSSDIKADSPDIKADSQSKVGNEAKTNSTSNKTDNAPNKTKSTPEVTKTMEEPMPQVVEVKKQSNSAAIFAIIFSLAALAGVAFSWYQNQVLSVRSESSLAIGVTEIGGQVSRIGDTVGRLQEQQSKIVSDDKLNASLQEISISLDKKIEQLASKQAQLLASVDTINSDLKSGTNAYVVDEVAQLLKLANNSLVYAGDSDSALNALTVAAAQLKSVTDPRYNQVRTRIAAEVAQLKNIQEVDVQGLSASLSAIAARISSLPLINEPEATAISFSTEVSEESSGWRAELASLWTEVKSAIQVQRVETAPKPLLAPDQRYFLDQNLQLMIGKAELALLQQQEGIFQQNLDGASQWIRDYFDVSDTQVQSVLSQLSEIRNQKVVIELPSVTGSYEALQAIKGGQ